MQNSPDVDSRRIGADSLDRVLPRYSQLKDKDFEMHRRGEESFRWEYKWK